MMQKLTKNNILMLVIAVLAVLLIVVGFNKQKTDTKEEYSVVYLSTGDIYVGKLSTFPRMVLKDGYIYQIVKDTLDPNRSSFQLQPLSETLWAPREIVLVRKNVVFHGPLLESGKVVQALLAQKK